MKMKKKDENKRSFIENLRMILRGMKMTRTISGKPLAFSKFLSGLFDALIVFPNLYLSALILNELAGTRDTQTLIRLAIITVGVNAVLLLAKDAAQRWTNYLHSIFWEQMNSAYSGKLFDMDFCDVEDAEVHQLLSTIYQNRNWGAKGLSRMTGMFSQLTTGAVKIICSVALVITLFTLKVPESGDLAFMNSPWLLAAVFTVLAIAVMIPPMLSAKANDAFAKQAPKARMGNRLFFFYGGRGGLSSSERAMDVRIYQQDAFAADGRIYPAGYWSTTFRDVIKKMAGWQGTSNAVTYLMSGAVYAFVALKALGGAFGVGNVLMYVGAIASLTAGIGQFVNLWVELVGNNAFLADTFRFFDIPNKMYQGSLSVEKRDDFKYEIEFRDVSFKYPNTDVWALRHVNLKFRIGERLAIVGMNGSGKTTFIKLLCRLYDPTEGEIYLNDFNIRKYDYKEYMDIFSVVFQDFKLLAFPLGQNVAVAKNYDAAKAEKCLNEAGFSQRLSELEHGLDTPLYKDFDKDGVQISGGEAQKIALARALYKDAPFVILDEPTAALDPVAEYEVYSKFNTLVGDKTAVFISHRLSSCRFCDDIAVFDEGQLVQRGSHNELLADEKGKYSELWNAQAQYYK
ncbi:MAG TPA: ABC transporter ATP-binding protein [Oscillospiraceae bacterium]|nr:ABC transporter ATP-binding protein [Oscillospiraceae bacterium]HPF55769.1 ABC transporter ATP-binding protein [Clostridiales bacterium]HPK35840.1 ABC transporter ATP-binding protein [Oscillospiraceae bacterium]HPR76005.1 ABC transporter ATP-binding protein [Oscillospiraceae bacterium]